jgi:L-iditol 2-dehydrogenase
MKAAVLEDVNRIVYRSVPDPELQRGDMLLKVTAATVCGTDIRILRGRKTAGIRYPSVIGHEFAAEVVDAGGHSQFKPGQPVAVCPAFACGHCALCQADAENLCLNLIAMGYEIDGAFAEYVRVPMQGVQSGNVFALKPGVTPEVVALAEPLACVINGQERVRIERGDTVVVLGAGPIGLLHVKLAQLAGAKRVIVSQRSATRRDVARAAGADVVIDPNQEDVVARVKHETAGLGADVAICAIGNTALANQAIAMVGLRGRVSLFSGFTPGATEALDVNKIHYSEIFVTGAFGLTRRQFKRALELIENGHIEVASMLSLRFALCDINAAMAAAESGTTVKVAIVNE